jgi:hypothetical protein
MEVNGWKERTSEGKGALILPEKYCWKVSKVVIFPSGI